MRQAEAARKAEIGAAIADIKERMATYGITLEDLGGNPVVTAVDSPYGTRYSVDGELQTPSGRLPRVRTVWIGGAMITEHASVVLTEDISSSGLQAGDVGVVVHIHRQGVAYEVEFMTLDGGTLAIETLEARQVREAGSSDVPHVRERIAA